jgi:hypothetical protein
LFTVNPQAHLLDLSHRIPPQNLTAAAYFLADTLPWFPRGTIHVVVVDPGVGTGRALLCVEWHGQTILVPDNGCWTSLIRQEDPRPGVFRLEHRRYWRPDVSATFHGRDILAPVGGHLTLGVRPADLGPPVSDWIWLELPQPQIETELVRGEVVVVDSFGNLVSNIPGATVPADGVVRIAGQDVPRRVRTYGDAEPGALVALIGSGGRLEVAVVQGSAAARLGVGTGTPVEVAQSGGA